MTDTISKIGLKDPINKLARRKGGAPQKKIKRASAYMCTVDHIGTLPDGSKAKQAVIGSGQLFRKQSVSNRSNFSKSWRITLGSLSQ